MNALEVVIPVVIALGLGLWQLQMIGDSLEMMGREDLTRGKDGYAAAGWCAALGFALMAGYQYVGALLIALAVIGLVLSIIARKSIAAKKG